MRKLLAIIVIALASNVFAQQKEIKIGDNASQYRLKIVTQKNSIEEKSIADLKGNIIIMQWMANGCSGSKEQIKSMDSYYKKYGNNVSFYAITDDPVSVISTFKRKNNYTFAFCKDKGKMENELFYFTAASHMAIINREGICLYRGSPDISSEVLDTLIAKGSLPLKFQKSAIENFNLKQYSYGFEEWEMSMESNSQTGFKLEPYKPDLISVYKLYTGKYFYGYNLPVYSIYRDGLLLSDIQISIPDPLKQKLDSKNTANLYMTGFNIRKKSKSNYRYRKILKNYLDSAFGITTKLITKKEDVIILTKINEGQNITKTKDILKKTEVREDTLILNNSDSKGLAYTLQNHIPLYFSSDILKLTRYNINLVIDKKETDKGEIIKQLREQGIEAKIGQEKIQHLDFLAEKETGSITYLHTKQKQTIFKFGYKIGRGKGYHDFSDITYQGKNAFAFKAGVFTQIKFNNYLALQPEINYQTNGSKGNYAETRLHSIHTPLNILLSTSQQHPLGVYLKGGGYYSYNFAGRMEGQNTNFNKSVNKNILGLSYGFGVRVGSKTIEFSYNRGLSNMIKNSAIGNVKEKSRHLTWVAYF